jgi:hypothetical protein
MNSAAETAAVEGDVERLKSALDADPEAVVRRYGPGEVSLLVLASVHGHAGAVSFLLNAGADPNAVYVNGETALMFGASARWPDVVRVLIAGGAELDRRDTLGMTALHKAVLGGMPYNRTSAADTVRALLDAGADASIPDQQGRLPLQLARHRRWRCTAPLLRWQLSGYYPVGRNDAVVRMLEDAASSRAR